MQRWPLNRHAGWDVWPHFDPGRWIDFNPCVVRLPSGRLLALLRRDACPPVPGKGTVWQVPVDEALQPTGTPAPLLARGEDPRAVVLGTRLLLFYCVIDRDAEDRVCGSTMMLSEYEIDSTPAGDTLRPVAGFQLPKNPIGAARPGDTAAAWEKNWVPFAVSPTAVALIYSHEPWQVLVLDCNPAASTRRFSASHAGPALRWRYGQVRGGTPPVPFGPGRWITFFHSSQVVGSRKVYFVGACVFGQEAPFQPLLVTRDPLLAAPYRSGAHRFGWRFAGSVLFPLGAQPGEAGYRLLCGIDDGEIGSFLVGHDALADRLEHIDALAGLELSDGDGQRLQTAGPVLLGRPAAESWPLARLLELLGGRGRGFVDYGAGDGVASLTLADGFAHGLAVEPDAARRRTLQRNLAVNGLGPAHVQVHGPIDSIDAAAPVAVDVMRIDAAPRLAAVLQGAAATIARDRPLLLMRLSGDEALDTPALAWLDAQAYDSQRLLAHHPLWCLALPRERRAAWAWFC